MVDKKVRMSSFWIEGELVGPFLSASQRSKRPGDKRDGGKTAVLTAALREYLKMPRVGRELSIAEWNWVAVFHELKPADRKIALRVARALRLEEGKPPDTGSVPSKGNRNR